MVHLNKTTLVFVCNMPLCKRMPFIYLCSGLGRRKMH